MTDASDDHPILKRLREACDEVGAPPFVWDQVRAAVPVALHLPDAAVASTLHSPGWKNFENALVEACHDILEDDQLRVMAAVVLAAARSGVFVRMHLARELRLILCLTSVEVIVLQAMADPAKKARERRMLRYATTYSECLQTFEAYGMVAGEELTAVGSAVASAMAELV